MGKEKITIIADGIDENWTKGFCSGIIVPLAGLENYSDNVK
jgi:hypothetical protein